MYVPGNGGMCMQFKPPKFVRYIARPLFFALFGVGTWSVVFFFIVMMFKEGDTLSWGTVVLGVFCIAFLIAVTLFIYMALWDKLLASLTVSSDCIVWKSPLKKTRRIMMDEVRYVGIEYEDSYNGLPYAYIYVSAAPYPKEYAHKINKLRCKDDFLIFRFTTELKVCLIATIPKGRSVALYDCDDFEANIHRRKAKKKRRK